MQELLTKVKSSSLFKDSFWALFGSVIGKGLSLLAGILVARFLGSELYGQFGVLQTTVMQTGLFATFGLGYTATKFVAEYRDCSPDLIGALCKLLIKITFVTSTLLCITVFIFSTELAIFLKAPELSMPIRICCIVIVLNGLTTTQIGILSGFNHYKIIAKNNTFSGILTFFLCCTLTFRWGFNGAMYSLLIAQFFNFAINRIAINNATKDVQTQDINEVNVAREILSFSLPVALQESCVFILGWFFTYNLIYLTNYTEVGTFSAASQWSAIILFIPGVLRNVTLSHLSGAKNHSSHKRIMNAMIFTNTIATVLPYIVIIIFNNLITRVYGASYVGLGLIMAILNASTIPNCISNVYVQEFMSINKNWHVLFLRLIKDVSSIAFAYLLIKNSIFPGAISAAVSVTTTSILYLVFLYITYKYLISHGNCKTI